VDLAALDGLIENNLLAHRPGPSQAGLKQTVTMFRSAFRIFVSPAKM
jgi:hypothetical protein